jgi:hypothetical protein
MDSARKKKERYKKIRAEPITIPRFLMKKSSTFFKRATKGEAAKKK